MLYGMGKKSDNKVSHIFERPFISANHDYDVL